MKAKVLIIASEDYWVDLKFNELVIDSKSLEFLDSNKELVELVELKDVKMVEVSGKFNINIMPYSDLDREN